MVPHPGPTIRLTRPVTGSEEADAVREVLESGIVAQGPRVEAFENALAGRVQAKHAIATSSCTTALHLAMVTLGVCVGDEVAVSDFTFPATANVVAQNGATPVPIDIDPATYAMDPADFERRINKRTKAVIVVDPVGSPADHKTISDIARAHNIAVVIDAACSLGGISSESTIGDNRHSDITCFSFHARKIITTGEGGMLTTNNPDTAAHARALRTHGGVRTNNRFSFEQTGFNYRLSDLQAAVGLVQLDRLDTLIQARQRLARALKERLSPLAQRVAIQLPADPPWAKHLYQSFVVLLPIRADRDAVIAHLADHRIESTLGTYAVHAEPAFTKLLGTKPGDRPNAWRARTHALSLPLHPAITENEFDAVAGALRSALAAQGLA